MRQKSVRCKKKSMGNKQHSSHALSSACGHPVKAINACEKASDWQAALQVFLATPNGMPNEITYNTTISACHKGSHWQPGQQHELAEQGLHQKPFHRA